MTLIIVSAVIVGVLVGLGAAILTFGLCRISAESDRRSEEEWRAFMEELHNATGQGRHE